MKLKKKRHGRLLEFKEILSKFGEGKKKIDLEESVERNFYLKEEELMANNKNFNSNFDKSTSNIERVFIFRDKYNFYKNPEKYFDKKNPNENEIIFKELIKVVREELLKKSIYKDNKHKNQTISVLDILFKSIFHLENLYNEVSEVKEFDIVINKAEEKIRKNPQALEESKREFKKKKSEENKEENSYKEEKIFENNLKINEKLLDYYGFLEKELSRFFIDGKFTNKDLFGLKDKNELEIFLTIPNLCQGVLKTFIDNQNDVGKLIFKYDLKF